MTNYTVFDLKIFNRKFSKTYYVINLIFYGVISFISANEYDSPDINSADKSDYLE